MVPFFTISLVIHDYCSPALLHVQAFYVHFPHHASTSLAFILGLRLVIDVALPTPTSGDWVGPFSNFFPLGYEFKCLSFLN